MDVDACQVWPIAASISNSLILQLNGEDTEGPGQGGWSWIPEGPYTRSLPARSISMGLYVSGGINIYVFSH